MKTVSLIAALLLVAGCSAADAERTPEDLIRKIDSHPSIQVKDCRAPAPITVDLLENYLHRGLPRPQYLDVDIRVKPLPSHSLFILPVQNFRLWTEASPAAADARIAKLVSIGDQHPALVRDRKSFILRVDRYVIECGQADVMKQVLRDLQLRPVSPR